MSRYLVSPVLVGRHDELNRLRVLLTRAIAGQPAVALVAGEAGVGKTRLVQEIAQVAGDSGVRVLSGGCVELGGEGLPRGCDQRKELLTIRGRLVHEARRLWRDQRPRSLIDAQHGGTASSARRGVEATA